MGLTQMGDIKLGIFIIFLFPGYNIKKTNLFIYIYIYIFKEMLNKQDLSVNLNMCQFYYWLLKVGKEGKKKKKKQLSV